MSYVYGKSRNRIVHMNGCRYTKMIQHKEYFSTLKEASDAGYVQCRYCSKIMKYLNSENKQLKDYCISNGVYFYFDPADGSVDVISRSGRWKIIVNGQRNQIWLYHRNNPGTNTDGFVPGYHSQKIRSSSLMGYMNYIVEHDRYRQENPLYECQKRAGIKGSKGEKRRAEKIRRMQSIRYVNELIDSMARGKIAY